MNKNKYRIYVDMDDVLCDFLGEWKKDRASDPGLAFPQSRIGFFLDLPPLPDAIDSVNWMRQQPQLEIYILSAPSNYNPHSYTEKRLWIEKHFDFNFTDKIILSSNKGLLKGDMLIDDYNEGKGQEDFEGVLLHFGSDSCPNWKDAIKQVKKVISKNE